MNSKIIIFTVYRKVKLLLSIIEIFYFNNIFVIYLFNTLIINIFNNRYIN